MEYLSKQLNASECNYSATKREFIKLIEALCTWRHYLLGRNIVRIDHASLQWLTKQPHLLCWQVHWLEFMSEFDLTISHVPGKANIVADALLQQCDLNPANCTNVMMGTESDLLDSIKRAQEYDWTVSFGNLKGQALVNERGMCMHEGLVCHQSRTSGQTIVIPEDSALRQRILALHHDSWLGGHLGAYRMIGSISTLYYWPKITADVRACVKQCQTCQACKVVTHNSQGYIRPLLLPEYCWQHVTMDLITCLPKMEHGVDAIATFVDHRSKYTYFVPVNTCISADELAQVFLATVIAWHGVPERLILNHDPHFVSAFQKGLMSALGAQVALSTIYHPQTDGQSEQQHRSLEQIQCYYVLPRQYDWDLLLPCAKFVLNTTCSSSTGYTPAYTIYGHDPNFPLEDAVRKVTDCHVASVLEYVACMSDVVQQVHSALAVISYNMERQANRHHRDSDIKVGANAQLSIEHLRLPPGLTRKFAP